MSSFLLNIGHDVAGLLIEMIAYVNKVRASSRVLRIILWPISYALTFAKVMTLYLANGCRQFYNHSFPEGVVAMRNHVYSATPASIYCFTKTQFLIFLLESYFFCFFCGWCFERPMRMFPYLLVKVIVTALPFLALSPTQRLPFWFLAVVLTFFEVWMGLFLILAMGFGINFRDDHFYNHWAKHYRYRAPTSNREIFVELCCYAFVIVKLCTLNDVWCSWRGRYRLPVESPTPERMALVKNRLAQPHTPTKGDINIFDNPLLPGALNGGLLLLVCTLFALCYILLLRNTMLIRPRPFLKELQRALLSAHKTYRNKNMRAPSTHKQQPLRTPVSSAALHTVSISSPLSPYPFLWSLITPALLLLLTPALPPVLPTLHHHSRPVANYISHYYVASCVTPDAQYQSETLQMRGSDFEPWLDVISPNASQTVLCFLPELTLAFVIMYLIGVVATELAANRPPKVIAIECWQTACNALAFVAFLYFVQLLGYTPNCPAVHDYLYISKGLTASKLLVTLTSLFVLHLSGGYIREHTRHILEFSIVILLGVLLLLILVSANNLMLLFLSLAGFSLNLYILILYDGADAASREASLKYFYLSTLSAGFILFGVLLIYTMIGDVTYYMIRVHTDVPVDAYTQIVMSVGVLFIVLGFFFKLSAFPGHLWAVEVYEGSPLPIMAFFILPVKVAVFIAFLRLLNTAFLDFSHIWIPCVTWAALASLVWGSLAATASRKITRYLGYASITQMGFLLLGLVTETDDGIRSAFFYLIIYAIMTGGFLLIFTHIRKADGQPLLALSDFRGLGKSDPRICWHLSVFLFSMAGIPPLAGFFGKYYLMSALMDQGRFVPIIIALLVSLIATYYYLRIIKTFWFEENLAIKPLVVLLSAAQRRVLAGLEASLWASAIFAPWLLPALTGHANSLLYCADIFAQTSYPIYTSAPTAQTVSALAPDFEFINALVEQDTVANLQYGVLFLLALSSLGVYSIILAGWSSNSKYAFIGALRSAAQMISYEVAISLIILPVVSFSGSLNLSMITYVQHITAWLLWPLLPVALLFLVAMLAETNRTPFDLPEAEAELVAGYNVDYSSLPFAMFFLGEYCNMILISTLYCLLFLSGGLNTLGLASALVLSAKSAVTWVFFVLVRATLPRYRYDQLMDIGWKTFLPVAGSFLLFAFGILVFFSALPVANELPLSLRLPALAQ